MNSLEKFVGYLFLRWFLALTVFSGAESSKTSVRAFQGKASIANVQWGYGDSNSQIPTELALDPTSQMV